MGLSDWLAYPDTKGMDIDAPENTLARRKIFQKKLFLRRLYEEFYDCIITSIPTGRGAVVELGSGGGFFKERLPEIFSSEPFFLPNLSLVLDGHRLPFQHNSLRAIVMTNVFHHLRPKEFLNEASLCVRKGGVIAMLEPWISPWSSFIFRNLHHEACTPDMRDWTIPLGGPLSGADAALPWVVFERDRSRFAREHPEWTIREIRSGWPISYLLSGGVSLRSLMFGQSFPLWRSMEKLLHGARRWLAMWALIVLERTETRALKSS